MFYCAAPLSGAFGGLLATGLAEIRYAGYNRKARQISSLTLLTSWRLALDLYC